MWVGRGSRAANGSCSVFSTLLNTRNRLDLGKGVMLLPAPCMMLASNHRAEPAGPVNWSMPYCPASEVMSSSVGTPTVCFFSDEAWLLSGVSPTLGTYVLWEPGITMSPPLNG